MDGDWTEARAAVSIPDRGTGKKPVPGYHLTPTIFAIDL